MNIYNYYNINECVYKIKNIYNNKVYIGQTLSLINRVEGHYKDLVKNKHNKKLQKDYDEYGINAFIFEVIEIIDIDRIGNKKLSGIYMHHRENYYIDKYNSIEAGYNTNRANKIDYTKIDANKSDYYYSPKQEIIIKFKEFMDLQLSIRDLVNLYMEYNPQNNRGLSFKIKANEIITSYIMKHGMELSDVKKCIETYPICKVPIWTQFFNYWFKEGARDKKMNNINKKKVENKSNYKNSVSDSTDVNDWM